jgi:glycerol kinase
MISETTALGAAYLAGLAVGFWADKAEIAVKWNVDRKFQPQMGLEVREELYQGWQRAVGRTLNWES